jgi:hypothetical protein
MTEPEWLACADPKPMLAFMRDKASERKLRLFAAACFRNLGHLLPDSRQHRGIELLDQMADGTATMAIRRTVTSDVRHALPPCNFVAATTPSVDPYYVALMLYRALASSSAAGHAMQATAGLGDGVAEQGEQCGVVRDIFGPMPFRPIVLAPSWLTPTVVLLAQTIYDDRAFDRIPALADALHEAGCDNEEILNHCRGPGPHVRGCWVVDLVLGKG